MKPSKSSTLSEWLFHLEHLPQDPIQLGLTRIKKVADALQLLHPKAKVISVAGTNGKGSTVAALEAIYSTQSYRVAAYTSPHLIRFNERITLNKQAVQDEVLAEAFSVIEEARCKEDVFLTYFEMTTLAALWCFQQHPLDILILEVGMGGRLDATNIIDADLAIITTIDFDHQHFLGTTKEAIGYEKAGILRPHNPFIYADDTPPKSIINQALSLHCPQFIAHKDYHYLADSGEFFTPQDRLNGLPKPRLHPNAIGAAIMASILFKPYLPVSISAIKTALETVFLPGRLHWVSAKRETLFDVSHNPQGVNLLATTLQQLNWKGKVHLVFSALNDKDILGMLRPLIKHAHYWYPAILKNQRAASQEQLDAAFKICGIMNNFYYNDPRQAYEVACNASDRDDLIVVYGSFLTVGDVLPTTH